MTYIIWTIIITALATALLTGIAVKYLSKNSEKSSRAKSSFLARMSHEIRTPITAVLGISEIQLQKTNMPIQLEEAFAKIHSSASILLGIVNDILDISKIESGKMSVIEEKYEVTNLIVDVSQLHLVYLGSKNIDFKINADENLPAFLIGDELRIKQIINNLLSNAFKYTEEGTVEFSLRRIDSTREGYINLEIIIKDTGYGMSQVQLDELYSEYSRFHENRLRSVVGAGLGMPIVHSLVNMMDATIEVESEVGLGTKVLVNIPQATGGKSVLGPDVVNDLQKSETIARFKKSNINPEPMPYGKVLVVDDVETNLYVAQGLLGFYELQLEMCDSGQAAIDKVRKGALYDIIFMDQTMPGLSGMETAKILRDEGYDRPIVALTANALRCQAEEFMMSGFSDFISKPIRTAHLDSILTKFIRDRQPPEVIEAARSKARQVKQEDIYGFYDAQKEELRRLFVLENQNAMKEMREAIDEGDLKTAHRLAHTLKGMAAMIDEVALHKLAELAEKLLKNYESPELDVLEAEFDQVLFALQGGKVGSLEKYGELLESLHGYLLQQDAECLLHLDELRELPEAKVLVRQIEDFEFDTAIKTLETLRIILDEANFSDSLKGME